MNPSNSRDELLALLQKQIEERETAREKIQKSIQILKEAERELRQKGAAPLRQDEEQTDHLPYRIHSGPGRAFDPQDELDDIKLLKKKTPPRLPRGEESKSKRGRVYSRSRPRKGARRPHPRNLIHRFQWTTPSRKSKSPFWVAPAFPPESRGRHREIAQRGIVLTPS